MNHSKVFVREIRPEEAQMFFDWAVENPVGDFDPATPLYPSSKTWCVYDKTGPLAYQTIQQPLMLETVAPRPGATKQQVAVAMRELTQNAVTQAHLKGVGEIYFLGSDGATNEFATNNLFEALPHKVYRLKIKDLECA